MNADGISEKGPRKENQDSILIKSKDSTGLFLVADGVGGSAKGKLASHLIADHMNRWWKRSVEITKEQEFISLFDSLTSAAEHLNTEIYSHYGAGVCCSTLSMLLVCGKQYGYLSVGDSRIYQCNSPFPRLLTRDDVWENLAEHGRSQNNNRGKIVSAVGLRPNLDYSLATGRFGMHCAFILCSDGVHRFVPDRYLKRKLLQLYVFPTSLRQVISDLELAAKKGNTKDNYSIIAITV